MAARVGVGLVGRFLGNAVSEAAAFAAGVALGPVLGPPVQAIRNEVNADFPFVPIGPGMLAEGVAQGQIGHDTAQSMAAHSGISSDNFDHMVAIANVGPGSGVAFDLWRREVIDEPGFRRAVKRLGLEQEWIDDLVKIKQVILSPEVIANAVQQGHVANDDILPPIVGGALPFDIPLTQIAIDPIDEAKHSGVSKERLQVLANLSGLPPPQGELRDMLNRGIITPEAFEAGIREGHTKTKWVKAVAEMAKAVLSPADGAGLRLRGWITPEESYTIGAKHGYSKDQMDQLFLNRGRPATVHQIHIGYARGGAVQGATNEEEAIRDAVKRSDIRPEYEDVLWRSRYTLPGAFALRALAESQAITEQRTHDLLTQSGWPPDLAGEVAKAWSTPSAAAAKQNPYIGKAEGQLWVALHKQYVKYGSARTDVEPILTVLIPDDAPRNHVFTLWDDERTAQALPAAAA